MKLLHTTILVLILFFISIISCFSQESVVEDGERNYPTYNYSIHASYATLLLSNQLVIGVERKIWQKKNFRTKAKVFYNSFLNNDFDFAAGERIYSSHLGLGIVQLISLFELNVGVGYSTYEPARGIILTPTIDVDETQNSITLHGSAGMRFELNMFLVRFGVGNLDHLYLGVGFSF